jgi:hypothetical protein
MPPVRLAPRDELAASARVAPLLRAARDLRAWAAQHPEIAISQVLDGRVAWAAAEALELTLDELDAAWQVAAATSGTVTADQPAPGSVPLSAASAEDVLHEWDTALAALLAGEELDGLATALYTVGAPVRIEALFDAYTAAAGSRRLPGADSGSTGKGSTGKGSAGKGSAGKGSAGKGSTAKGSTGKDTTGKDSTGHGTTSHGTTSHGTTSHGTTSHGTKSHGTKSHGVSRNEAIDAGVTAVPDAGVAQAVAPRAPNADEAAALSHALETLADLGVVELGTEEHAGGLTVVLSPLGVWGVHRRLLAQGWHVPVLGAADRDGAVGLLMTLASCDAEDGESKINEWLVVRSEEQAAAELIAAAATGTPGLRGAAFAVLDRIGKAATEEVRAALDEPLLRAHAAVWLHEQGEDAALGPADRTWLLVDLGAGLLEEADPRDVVAELLPDVAPAAQAEIVAGLWQVRHPGVIDLLTTLSEHHPDPGVARAARKAAFKARSPEAGAGPRAS